MGDEIKKVSKKIGGAPTGLGVSFDQLKKVNKKITQTGEKPFRKGTTSKGRNAANLAKEQLASQQKAELLRKVESEDEIARRRGLASSKGSGRRSLIRTAPTGLAKTLGG